MRVSIIVNNYNNERYLRACLDSVFAQSGRKADEILVYDDGSTDGSWDILASYGGAIRVLYGKRERLHGPAYLRQGVAIERAIAETTGEIVFLLDGDDTFLPHRLERYLAAFASPANPVMVQAPMQIVDEAGEPHPRPMEPFRHAPDLLATIYERNDPDVLYPTSALAFRRSVIERWVPLNWQDGEEVWLDVRLGFAALVSGPVVTLPEECGQWRWHRKSAFTSRAQQPGFLLRQTRLRVRQFNYYCDRTGRPRINLWRSRRFWGQVVGAGLPWMRQWRNRIPSLARLKPSSQT